MRSRPISLSSAPWMAMNISAPYWFALQLMSRYTCSCTEDELIYWIYQDKGHMDCIYQWIDGDFEGAFKKLDWEVMKYLQEEPM